MTGVRTVRPAAEWTVARAVAAKDGRRIAVCIPCRNEAATIGPLVTLIRTALVDDAALVDDLVVLDDDSTDGTPAIAAAAGARVVSVAEVVARAGHEPLQGKGNVLWASLLATDAELVVWCDADLTSFDPSWVVRLVVPLLCEENVGLVKADYERPADAGGGGRTTELTARPLLSLYFPELAGLRQPLGGEMAGRRSLLERVPFVAGWGVEVGLLVDISRTAGVAAIAQVDLGVRRHRHRSLVELGVQAAEVAATILRRAGVPLGNPEAGPPALRRPSGAVVPLNLAERPPIVAGPAAHPCC